MSSQLVDLVLTSPTAAKAPGATELAAEQVAWLNTTSIVLRSVTFHDFRKRQTISQMLAVSEQMLAASAHTLEVNILCKPIHHPSKLPHHSVQKPVLATRIHPHRPHRPTKLSSCRTVQEIHNMYLPKPPQSVTTLGRFPQLRCLSLLGLEGLKPDQVCRMVLPALGRYCHSAARSTKSCPRPACFDLSIWCMVTLSMTGNEYASVPTTVVC